MSNQFDIGDVLECTRDCESRGPIKPGDIVIVIDSYLCDPMWTLNSSILVILHSNGIFPWYPGWQRINEFFRLVNKCSS